MDSRRWVRQEKSPKKFWNLVPPEMPGVKASGKYHPRRILEFRRDLEGGRV